MQASPTPSPKRHWPRMLLAALALLGATAAFVARNPSNGQPLHRSASPAIAVAGLPAAVTGSFRGTAQVFESSLRDLGVLLIIAILVIYIVLGILYESFFRPFFSFFYHVKPPSVFWRNQFR